MSLADPGLAPPAEPESARLPRKTGSLVGLGQAAPAKLASPARMSFGDVELSIEEAARLATFLQEEILRSLDETREWREAVALWREFVDPRPREKTFPWPHASSVFVPLPRIILDSFKSTIKQTIQRQKKRYTAELISAKNAGIDDEDIEPALRAAEDFAEKVTVEAGFLELDRALDDLLEELLTTGIGPIKLAIETDVRQVVVKGGEVRDIAYSVGPRVFAFPVDTFVWPTGFWRSIDDMPWAGHFVTLTASELRRRAGGSWKYRNVEEVIAHGVSPSATTEPSAAARQVMIRQINSQPTFQTYETYLLWDLYNDGVVHDLVVTFNADAGLIHRIIYNEAGDGRKPIEAEVASPRSGTVFGRGVIEPIVQPVRAINTAINQTFDSQTLANAPVILTPEESEASAILAQGFVPGTGLTYKEDPKEIQILKFPDPSGISFQMVQFFMGIIERLTRIGPAQLGEVSAGRRTPASLGFAMQQAGRELADELIDRLRDRLGRIVSRAFLLYLEDDPDIFVRLLGEERGLLLRGIVERSRAERRSVGESIRIRLSASSATRSVELERQNALAVAQLLFGYFKQAIELVQLFLTPNAPAVAQEILLDIVRSSQEQMRRIVELANQPDASTLVPDLASRLEDFLSQPPSADGGAAATAGGPASALPPELAAGLAGGFGGGAPV